MSYRTTLVLLAILVIAGGFVYWQDIRPGAKKEEPRPTQVLNVAPKDVNSLMVTFEGKSMELQKESELKWNLTKPEFTEADFWGVEGMVIRLGTLNANRVLTGTVGDLAAYGLDRPILEARLGTAQGKRETIIVGDKTPDGMAYYVKRMNADPIFLVATSIISDVAKLAVTPPKALPTPTPAPPTPANQ